MCLYGPDVEVFTLRVDVFSGEYQAVAMRFDHFNATWIKFQHSELVSSSADAIKALLRQSEIEVANLFTENTNTLPFKGI